MDRWRQINRMIFHLAACLLPAYNRCRWGNKVKNAFAQNAFLMSARVLTGERMS